MSTMYNAKDPFRFYTRLNLPELTGVKAFTLGQLADAIRQVPGSSIYHHTHRFLQQHQYLSPEPPNDFAFWVNGALGEDDLGERLASIDTIQFSAIRALREKIALTIEEYLKERPLAKLKFAREDEAFHFIKSVSFVLPTKHVVSDLKQFVDTLEKITNDSIYFHIFEARLRLEKGTNDFSNWIESSLGDKELADEIAQFDPYTYTLEELRNTLIKVIKEKISG